MAAAFETSQTAARVYAEALLALAIEGNALDAIEPEVRELARLWDSVDAFRVLMESAAIDRESRRASLRKIFAGRVSDLVLNTMLVLNVKGRSMVFGDMADAFLHMVDEKRGRQRVFVTTAIPLDDALRAKVTAQAKRLSGREPILVESVDPRIIGGIVLQIGDRVVDASVRLRLALMRKTLHRSMDRELAEGASRFASA